MFDKLIEVVVEQYGLIGLIEVAQVLLVVYLFKIINKKDYNLNQKDQEVKISQKDLLELSEKRLQDVVDDRKKYQELSENLDKSINLLVQVFKRRNGNGY